MASNSSNASVLFAEFRKELSPYLGQLSDDIYEMYGKGLDTDFHMHIGENTVLRCHKAIVSIRSPFFNNLIGMLDKAHSNTLRAPEIAIPIFRAIMDYIYSGDLSRIVTPELPLLQTYEMAEMFELLELQDFLALQLINKKPPTIEEKFNLDWKIENIESSGLFTNSEWEYPFQQTIPFQREKFYLRIKKVPSFEGKGFLVIALGRLTNMEVTHRVSLVVAILDSSKRRNFSHRSEYIFQKRHKYQLPSFVKLELIEAKKRSFITNDSLTLNFDIKIQEYDIKHDPNDKVKITDSDECSKAFIDGIHLLSSDLSRLFRSRTHSDLIHTAGDRCFAVHQCILNARLIFGKIEQQIILSYLHSDEVESFILFLYTGDSKHLEQHASALHRVGCTLGLSKVKQMYSSYLASSFTVDNVMARYYSYVYEDKELKESAMHFISLNSEAVFASLNWDVYAEMRPDLAGVVLEYVQAMKYNTNST